MLSSSTHPLAAKVRRVVLVCSARSITDGEGALRCKVEVWDALGHVRASVNIVYTVTEVVTASQNSGPSGRAHGAAGVKVHEGSGAVGLSPFLDARAVGRAVVVGEISPTDVVSKNEEKRRVSGLSR